MCETTEAFNHDLHVFCRMKTLQREVHVLLKQPRYLVGQINASSAYLLERESWTLAR